MSVHCINYGCVQVTLTAVYGYGLQPCHYCLLVRREVRNFSLFTITDFRHHVTLHQALHRLCGRSRLTVSDVRSAVHGSFCAEFLGSGSGPTSPGVSALASWQRPELRLVALDTSISRCWIDLFDFLPCYVSVCAWPWGTRLMGLGSRALTGH